MYEFDDEKLKIIEEIAYIEDGSIPPCAYDRCRIKYPIILCWKK